MIILGEEKLFEKFKIVQVISNIFALVLSIFILVTEKFEYLPYMLLFMGIFNAAEGITKMKEDKRKSGYLCFMLSLFLFFCCIKILFIR